MLNINNISSGYGKKQVLFDISMEINEGEIVLLTGDNGSGKSTLFKAIFGLIEKFTGKVFFCGENITSFHPSELIKKGLVYIPQKNGYFENLTVEENLQVSGSIYPNMITKNRIENVYQNIPLLKKFKSRTPFNLSGGERQLVAFGNALMHQPKLIMFDEPFAGLDSENQKIISNLIIKSKSNISYLIIEHITKINFEIDRKIHLELGKIKN